MPEIVNYWLKIVDETHETQSINKRTVHNQFCELTAVLKFSTHFVSGLLSRVGGLPPSLSTWTWTGWASTGTATRGKGVSTITPAPSTRYSQLPISNPRVINKTEVEVPYLGDWLGPRFFPFVYQGYY